jgi:hypothetical protein
MRRLGKFILLFVILLIGLLIFLKSWEYYSPDFKNGYLSDKKEIFDSLFKYGLYAHIITVPLILLAGSVQAFFRYEYSNKNFHRIVGSVYSYLVLFVSAPGAFIISFYAFGGAWGKCSFLLLTILWVWFTFCGLKEGKNKNIAVHKAFMIRSYVLTLSAIILRLISFVFIHIFDFYGENAYAVSAWLSWVPALLMTEVYLYYNGRKIPSLPSA